MFGKTLASGDLSLTFVVMAPYTQGRCCLSFPTAASFRFLGFQPVMGVVMLRLRVWVKVIVTREAMFCFSVCVLGMCCSSSRRRRRRRRSGVLECPFSGVP